MIRLPVTASHNGTRVFGTPLQLVDPSALNT